MLEMVHTILTQMHVHVHVRDGMLDLLLLTLVYPPFFDR